MTTNNTELKMDLRSQYSDNLAIAADKVLTFINSLPELAQFNITVRYETCNSFSHQYGWYHDNKGTYRFETRFSVVPALERTFGTELTVYCNKDGLSMNYGTCGQQNLGSDIGFIQKNLLIGILTLHQAEIKEFIMNLAEVQEMNNLMDQITAIEEAEWEAKQEAKAKAQKEAVEKAEAEKKAKAAERRKARRAARKAAQN